MELILKNFKWHTNARIKIPSKGLGLLKGRNGTGKTCILDSIVYALYGREKDVISHGQSTCEVTLIFKSSNKNSNKISNKNPNKSSNTKSKNQFNFSIQKIIRTSKPNRLIVITNKRE